MINYPTPVTRIHQIELSSKCNLGCKYCPHPKLKRAKAHMSMETFKRTMDHVVFLKDKDPYTDTYAPELSLTGMGEAVMNPLFLNMLHYARSVYEHKILFATNGILINEDLVKEVKKLDVQVYISLHRPEKATPAINLMRKYNIKGDVNAGFALSGIDWAGQVNWEITDPIKSCIYQPLGWVTVLQSGQVTTCCMDAEGFGNLGHVNDELGSLRMQPIDLCNSCHRTIPDYIKEVAA